MFWNIFGLVVNFILGGFLGLSCYKVAEKCEELIGADDVWEKGEIKGEIVSWLAFACTSTILATGIMFGRITFKIEKEIEKIDVRITAIETQMDSSRVDTLYLKDLIKDN